MNAYKFIEVNGLEKAKAVLNGAPDKTATHYEFRKIPSYYSTDFQSWFHDDEWWDSDCYTEQDLIDSYGFDFVISLEQLKQAIADLELVAEYKLPEKFWGFDSEKDEFGIEGTSMFLESYACYSNDEEKAILDRLQLALQRIEEGLGDE